MEKIGERISELEDGEMETQSEQQKETKNKQAKNRVSSTTELLILKEIYLFCHWNSRRKEKHERALRKYSNIFEATANNMGQGKFGE